MLCWRLDLLVRTNFNYSIHWVKRRNEQSAASLLHWPRSTTDQMQLVLLCRDQDVQYFVPGNGTTGQGPQSGIQLQLIGKGMVCNPCGRLYHLVPLGVSINSVSVGDSIKLTGTLAADLLSNRQNWTFIQSHGPERWGASELKWECQTHWDISRPRASAWLSYERWHDLCQGIVSQEVALLTKHLVRAEKQSTWLKLHGRMNQLKCLGSEACDKPRGGTSRERRAAQNCCFLRLLPVLIGGEIRKPDNNDLWCLV